MTRADKVKLANYTPIPIPALKAGDKVHARWFSAFGEQGSQAHVVRTVEKITKAGYAYVPPHTYVRGPDHVWSSVYEGPGMGRAFLEPAS